jgi:hypothetical protein
MNNSKLTPAAITILASAAVVLIGSFLDFYELDLGPFGSEGASAWSGDLFFPVTIIPVLCGLAMAIHIGMTAFGNAALPERVLGFGWNQIHLALGIQAAVMMVAFLVQDKGGFDIAIGFWLMLLGSIGLAVGAFLRQNEPAASAPPPPLA